MKFLSRLDSNSELKSKNKTVNASLDENIGNTQAFYNKFKIMLYKAHINDLLKLWDFPYIFFIMSLAIVIEIIVPGNPQTTFSISPIGLYLYFYAFSFPAIIIFILTKNVLFKVLEDDYQNLTSDFVIRLKDLKVK